MASLGPLMSRDETEALIARVTAIEAEHGHTFWAMERRSDSLFMGWCGLIRGIVGPIVGNLEIGWRIIHECEGKGYVREAAEASLRWGFETLDDDAIYAITSTGNVRSMALMARIGMTRQSELDFEHPKVADGDPLKPHVTYRILRDEWIKG